MFFLFIKILHFGTLISPSLPLSCGDKTRQGPWELRIWFPFFNVVLIMTSNCPNWQCLLLQILFYKSNQAKPNLKSQSIGSAVWIDCLLSSGIWDLGILELHPLIWSTPPLTVALYCNLSLLLNTESTDLRYAYPNHLNLFSFRAPKTKIKTTTFNHLSCLS